MDQYQPRGNVPAGGFEEIVRPVTGGEYLGALRAAKEAGIYRFA
jgi:uncharacterized Fe-S radical SAM superfamily protein PflX